MATSSSSVRTAQQFGERTRLSSSPPMGSVPCFNSRYGLTE
jgi:hypothetical protein